MKILVVDDERAVRESLRRALELEGYEIELAADGSEALYRLEGSHEPDAMILDVLMPGVDGLEVCRRLRGTGSKLPVLMLTARTEVDLSTTCSLVTMCPSESITKPEPWAVACWFPLGVA